MEASAERLPEKNHAPEDPCVPTPDDSDTHAGCTPDCTGCRGL